mmetsp:Transcript_13791/g.37268  ORF Transcript_13791/g.37268 Transcript_13791/m.37268 type:complete len:286 (-) Transcript_13791:2388-3245(-)
MFWIAHIPTTWSKQAEAEGLALQLVTNPHHSSTYCSLSMHRPQLLTPEQSTMCIRHTDNASPFAFLPPCAPVRFTLGHCMCAFLTLEPVPNCASLPPFIIDHLPKCTSLKRGRRWVLVAPGAEVLRGQPAMPLQPDGLRLPVLRAPQSQQQRRHARQVLLLQPPLGRMPAVAVGGRGQVHGLPRAAWGSPSGTTKYALKAKLLLLHGQQHAPQRRFCACWQWLLRCYCYCCCRWRQWCWCWLQQGCSRCQYRVQKAEGPCPCPLCASSAFLQGQIQPRPLQTLPS